MFDLSVITPEKKLFSGKAKKVSLPALSGQITILSYHTPLFTMLEPGKVYVTDQNDKVSEYKIGKGMVEVKKNQVSLLVETPEYSALQSQRKAAVAESRAEKIDKDKMMPKGKISTADAYRRGILDFKDVKRKRKNKGFANPPASSNFN